MLFLCFGVGGLLEERDSLDVEDMSSKPDVALADRSVTGDGDFVLYDFLFLFFETVVDVANTPSLLLLNALFSTAKLSPCGLGNAVFNWAVDLLSDNASLHGVIFDSFLAFNDDSFISSVVSSGVFSSKEDVIS